MIEIKTADDLININNNNTGNYILKNDIDLKSFSPWQPIDLFSGMFVNPEGYVIRNLTISSANEVTYGNDKYRYCKGGLFRTLEDAYIDGILLENININISDFEDEYRNASAGGITVSMLSSTIRNCHVTGTLQAQFYCGGIVGSNSWGYILDSSFSGTAKIVNATEYGKREVGVGGIVGRSATHERAGLISNCNVNATILGHKNAGGVVGYLWGSHNFSNCSFEGTVIGEDMMEIISFDGNVTMSNDTDNYSFLLIPEYTGMYTITSSQSLKYQILDGNEILKEDTNKLDYYVKKNNLYVINILKEDNIEAQIRVSPMFISQGTLNLSDLITEDNDIILSFQPSTTGYYGITLDINLENPIFESNMIKLYDDKFNQIKLYVPDRNLSNLEGNNELFYYMKTDKYYYISISNSNKYLDMSLTVNKATEDAKNQLFLDENQNINFKYDGILTDDFKYFIINESGIYRVSNYQTYKDNSILYFHFTYGGFTVMNGYSEGFYEKGELICFAIYADNPDFISSSYEITLLKIDDNS